MSQQIPSKPTTFRGIHYRSRLEARWAIFFQSLNLRYTYEPFIYQDKQSSITYTPDFLVEIQTRQFTFEIKPIYPKQQYIDFLKNFIPPIDRKTTVLAVGNFYQKEIPQIYPLVKGRPTTIINWIRKNLHIPVRNSRYAIQVASQYRFDI